MVIHLHKQDSFISLPCSSIFNSKYPSTDKYDQFKHPTHPPTQSTSYAHNDNDPGKKGTTSEKINKFGDSFLLKKELEYNYEQYTPETIVQDSLESEEISIQPSLFYFTSKPNKTPNLTKANLNQTLEQVHNNRNHLDYNLPLMEQDINLDAHKTSPVMLSTITEKASCETLIIDVVGIDSPIQKVAHSFHSDKLRQPYQNTDAFQNIQEIPCTGKISLLLTFLHYFALLQIYSPQEMPVHPYIIIFRISVPL